MENTLQIERNILIFNYKGSDDRIKNIKNNFCGKVIYNEEFIVKKDSLIYILSDNNIEKIHLQLKDKIDIEQVFIINTEEINFETYDYKIIEIGEVPINIHNIGVFFPKLFSDNKNYFNNIDSEHTFQYLTQSNHISNAFRKGIYLTPVYKDEKNNYHFHLLRCSSNLSGPSENFNKTDKEIVDKVNHISSYFFEQETKLNHVLAQIYHNFYENKKPKKAKIKAHSDKTKDMPRNAIMAFCTFYQKISEELKKSNFDYLYKNKSVLTKLRFRLKDSVKDSSLQNTFDITLYPNSVFIMSLTTNRLYTHEIIPSELPLDKLPLRMGYVIRCSDTKAIYNEDEKQTYIYNNIEKLKKMSSDEKEKLRHLYYIENTSTDIVTYGQWFSSMNEGDYLKPNL